MLLPLLLLLLGLWICHIVGHVLMGGFAFSTQPLQLKLSKLSPLAGIKRMLGPQSWLELVKSLLKVSLLVGMSTGLLVRSLADLQQIPFEVFPNNFLYAIVLLLRFIVLIACSLLIIALIDVPYQWWHHHDQLKMTLQEIKDEHKESEGKPEVKWRIRMLQREMAQRRMMAAVPSADVIITNPEHYAVALRYDPQLDSVPIVVAKGHDHMAMTIRKIAREHQIEHVPAPPLARAIFYSTELEQPIPDGLFTAVAQILAYVFQLKQHSRGQGHVPKLDLKNLIIPKELQR